MYIRFQTSEINEYSTKLSGIFSGIYEFHDSGELLDYEKEYLESLLKWFDNNLDVPEKFSRKTGQNCEKGISWFKDIAKEHITKMQELVTFLRDHGWFVEMITTDTPGYIVYEDDVQIVAEPFKETL